MDDVPDVTSKKYPDGAPMIFDGGPTRAKRGGWTPKGHQWLATPEGVAWKNRQVAIKKKVPKADDRPSLKEATEYYERLKEMPKADVYAQVQRDTWDLRMKILAGVPLDKFETERYRLGERMNAEGIKLGALPDLVGGIPGGRVRKGRGRRQLDGSEYYEDEHTEDLVR